MATGSDSVSLVCDVLLVFIFLAATASNSLVLLVFYRRPGLRTLSNRFVMNLLSTNLLSCWLMLPIVLADSTLPNHSQMICVVSQGVTKGLCSASVSSVLLIGVDQYFAVIDPLHYHSRIDTTRCAFMITLSWCFSALCAVVGGFFYVAPHSVWGLCGDSEVFFQTFVPDTYISTFYVSFFLVAFCAPFSIICWMYLSIYFAAHQNSQRARRNGSSAGYCASSAAGNPPSSDYAIILGPVRPKQMPPGISNHPVKYVDSADPPIFVEPTRADTRHMSSFMNSLRSRISNASLFKYREETRAARISALVIVMGLVCWSPYSTVVLLSSPIVGVRVPHSLAKLSVTSLVTAALVTPLLFAHRNRRIQRDLRKLFGLSNKSSSSCYRAESHKFPKRVLPPNYNHTGLELLASLETCGNEDKEQGRLEDKGAGFLNQVWWKDRVRIVSNVDKCSVNTLICVAEVILEVDHSRSSFSSGGSGSTQRSTSAASFSSYMGDEEY